jgi:cytoskeletal protein RodZ
VASLIDSSVLVDVERGRAELAVLLEEHGDRGFFRRYFDALEVIQPSG